MLKRFNSPQPIPPAAPAVKSQPVPEEPPKQEVQAAPREVPETPEAGNKLIVGPNIKLKGSEITDCDILLVEGRVEASMNSRDMRIAEGGIFVGVAEIDTAEVRGAFEGELIARKRLVIHASGKVSGKIRYGALTVHEGGTLAGDVGSLSASPIVAVADVRKDSSASKRDEDDSKQVSSARSAFGRSTLQHH